MGGNPKIAISRSPWEFWGQSRDLKLGFQDPGLTFNHTGSQGRDCGSQQHNFLHTMKPSQHYLCIWIFSTLPYLLGFSPWRLLLAKESGFWQSPFSARGPEYLQHRQFCARRTNLQVVQKIFRTLLLKNSILYNCGSLRNCRTSCANSTTLWPLAPTRTGLKRPRCMVGTSQVPTCPCS